MKISCETYLVNRIQPHIKNRWLKSTVGIGTHPPNKENTEYFLILFTTTNKTGTRYRIKNNIERVFTKCVAEGKVTVSFKDPKIDLQMKGDPETLKNFLSCLKLALEGKKADDGRNLAPPVASLKKYEPVKTKLVIASRKDYPIKGFPKELIHLTITGIKLMRLDSQILNLTNLTNLSLSDNKIETIPDKLGNLRLQVLDLSGNKLKHTSWAWLRERTIRATLSTLDLSCNELEKFPADLVNFKYLTRLNIRKNQIKFLPFSMRNMCSLRSLNVSSNLLTTIPSNLALLRLECLDVSDISFCALDHKFPVPFPDYWRYHYLQVPTLLELSAQLITRNGVFYSTATTPSILCDFINQMPLCTCGNIVFSKPVFRNSGVFAPKHSNGLLVTKDMGAEIPVDSVYCSAKCLEKDVGAL